MKTVFLEEIVDTIIAVNIDEVVVAVINSAIGNGWSNHFNYF